MKGLGGGGPDMDERCKSRFRQHRNLINTSSPCEHNSMSNNYNYSTSWPKKTFSSRRINSSGSTELFEDGPTNLAGMANSWPHMRRWIIPHGKAHVNAAIADGA